MMIKHDVVNYMELFPVLYFYMTGRQHRVFTHTRVITNTSNVLSYDIRMATLSPRNRNFSVPL